MPLPFFWNFLSRIFLVLFLSFAFPTNKTNMNIVDLESNFLFDKFDKSQNYYYEAGASMFQNKYIHMHKMWDLQTRCLRWPTKRPKGFTKVSRRHSRVMPSGLRTDRWGWRFFYSRPIDRRTRKKSTWNEKKRRRQKEMKMSLQHTMELTSKASQRIPLDLRFKFRRQLSPFSRIILLP